MATKPTIDDKEVPDRVYYYLLEWNERDEWETIWSRYGLRRLCDCTKEQVMSLFQTASESDYTEMKKK